MDQPDHQSDPQGQVASVASDVHHADRSPLGPGFEAIAVHLAWKLQEIISAVQSGLLGASLVGTGALSSDFICLHFQHPTTNKKTYIYIYYTTTKQKPTRNPQFFWVPNKNFQHQRFEPQVITLTYQGRDLLTSKSFWCHVMTNRRLLLGFRWALLQAKARPLRAPGGRGDSSVAKV